MSVTTAAPPAAPPRPPVATRSRRAADPRRTPRWAIYVPLVVYLLFTLVPFYWILLFAFRETGSTALFPWPLTLEHFSTVWNGAGFSVFFKNSVIIAVLTVFFSTTIALVGGYAMARFTFRGKGVFMLMMLCTQFIPGAMMLIPLFEIFRTLGLVNSLWSLVIAETVFQHHRRLVRAQHQEPAGPPQRPAAPLSGGRRPDR